MTGRPHHEQFLHGERGARTVVIPQRFIAWLDRTGALRRTQDLAQRHGDPLVDAVMLALGMAAVESRSSDPGSKPAPTPEVAARFDSTTTRLLTSRQAAEQLHMTTRAVTDACRAGRFPGARKDPDGRWWLHPDTVTAAATRRTA